MWILPLGATGVALAFSLLLARQYLLRRRPFQALWALALLMYAAASFALFLGVRDGWSGGEYRTYWLLGAVLNVPFLAGGEVVLLFRRRWVLVATILVLVFVAGFAFGVVRGADFAHPGALAKDLPLGKEVFGAATPAQTLPQYMAYPAYFLLLAGCLWSLRQMRGRPELRDRFQGTLGIAVGATIVAIGSGIGAGLDVVPLFVVGLVAGIVVMFWGFLRASRSAAAPAPS